MSTPFEAQVRGVVDAGQQPAARRMIENEMKLGVRGRDPVRLRRLHAVTRELAARAEPGSERKWRELANAVEANAEYIERITGFTPAAGPETPPGDESPPPVPAVVYVPHPSSPGMTALKIAGIIVGSLVVLLVVGVIIAAVASGTSSDHSSPTASPERFRLISTGWTTQEVRDLVGAPTNHVHLPGGGFTIDCWAYVDPARYAGIYEFCFDNGRVELKKHIG